MRAPILAALVVVAASALHATEDGVIGDFEGADLGAWTAEGTAFQLSPARDKERGFGVLGNGFVSSAKGGDAAQGTLLSPTFKIERQFINFLAAGTRDFPAQLGAELLIDGRVARAASATEFFNPQLFWRTWDVAEFTGRTAQIRVNDRSAGGAIAVDHFVQSDEAKAPAVDASTRLAETYRPQFHYTALSGWLNDANGMFFYKGLWHLCHQHRPPGAPAVMWGHAVSDDLLHWRHQPAAITLGDEKDAIFSGSAAVDWKNSSGLQHGDDPPILLCYTQHPPANAGRKATQCLAFSTNGGQTFEKFAGNPVLRTPDNNDRDPSVVWHTPSRSWFMVLSLSRNNVDREHATYGIFRSSDAKAWELIQEVGPGGWYWECPDFFEMPVDGDPARTKWVLMKGSGDYLLGSFDGTKFVPETEPIRTSFGAAYYGQQTFSDAPGGRRVSIGWMNSGAKSDVPKHYPGMPFNQQMSFPRELTLRNTAAGPRIFREPVREIETLYAESRDIADRALPPGENALGDFQPDSLDLDLELDLREAKLVRLTIRGAEVIIQGAKLKAFGRVLDLPMKDGILTLRALVDRTSIELFANRGEVTHSGVFFSSPSERASSLVVEGGSAQIRSLKLRSLRSIWSP